MTLATRLFHRAARFSTSIMPKAVLVNAGRLDYDRKLDFSRLERACGAPLTRHDDDTPSPSDIAARAVGHGILITKEVPVDVDALPDGVQLICEAGTGFNNVDLDAAARRGITVCNVPTYSTAPCAPRHHLRPQLLLLRRPPRPRTRPRRHLRLHLLHRARRLPALRTPG